MRKVFALIAAVLTAAAGLASGLACPRQGSDARIEAARPAACCCSRDTAAGNCCCRPGDPRRSAPEPVVPTRVAHDDGAVLAPAFAPSGLVPSVPNPGKAAVQAAPAPQEETYLSNCTFRC